MDGNDLEVGGSVTVMPAEVSSLKLELPMPPRG
jgi:hypothetical protein